jgi:hypothetical protein
MGDRRMAEIKLSAGSVYLYTHWHGFEWADMADEAIDRARERLGDEDYMARIIVDIMTKPGRDSVLGFGLMLTPDCEDEYNNNHPSIIFDLATGKVSIDDSARTAKRQSA